MSRRGPVSRIFEDSSICAGSYNNFNMYDEEASWTSLHSTILAGNIDERLTGPTDSLFLSTLEEQSENSNLDDPEIEVIEDDIESAESLKAILTSDEDDYYDCSDKSVNARKNSGINKPFDAFNTTMDNTVEHIIASAKDFRLKSTSTKERTVKIYNLENKLEENLTDLNNNNPTFESSNKTKSKHDKDPLIPNGMTKKPIFRTGSVPKLLRSNLKRKISDAVKQKVHFASEESEITSSILTEGNSSSCPDLRLVPVPTPKVRFQSTDSSVPNYNLKLNAGMTPKIVKPKTTNFNVHADPMLSRNRGATPRNLRLKTSDLNDVTSTSINSKIISELNSRVKKLKQLFEAKEHEVKKKDSLKITIVDTHITRRKPCKNSELSSKNTIQNEGKKDGPKFLSPPRNVERYPSSDLAYGTGCSDLSTENSLKRSSSLNDFLEEEDSCEIYQKVKKHLLERKEPNRIERLEIPGSHVKQSHQIEVSDSFNKQSKITNRKSIGLIDRPIMPVSELRKLFSPSCRAGQ